MPRTRIKHDTEDHVRYTKREIAKQLILLENHLEGYPCMECMTKHLLAIDGFSDEGIAMTNERIFSDSKQWSKDTYNTLTSGVSDQQMLALASSARDLRREFQDNAHLSEGEVQAEEDSDTPTLEHEESKPEQEKVMVIHP